MKKFFQDHPELAGYVFAGLAAWGAYCAFTGGMQAQRIRAAKDMIASDGLGG